MSDQRPVLFDDDNPEWTKADFAQAKPISEFPELEAAFASAKAKRGRPRGESKEQVTLRIDKDVLERFRASGPGWQSRINATLNGRTYFEVHTPLRFTTPPTFDINYGALEIVHG